MPKTVNTTTTTDKEKAPLDINNKVLSINIVTQELYDNKSEIFLDLKYWLSKIKGLDVELNVIPSFSGVSTNGLIVGVNSNLSNIGNIKQPFDKLSDESYVLYQQNEHQTFLISKDNSGIQNVVYGYLKELGFRWYYPGEIWSHVPDISMSTILNSIQKPIIAEPNMDYRDFFATGGHLRLPYLAEKISVKEDWDVWKVRNRFIKSHHAPSHIGYSFNLAKKNELLAHPEYLAEIDGERLGWEREAKLCVSNKKAVQLFLDYVDEQYNKTLKRGVYQRFSKIALSVEPADGGKHCTCKKCLAIGKNPSDRVFKVANDAVTYFEDKYPNQDIYITLYGYNLHANTPNIDLHPKVIVFLAPYAYQRNSTPEALINQWSIKKDKFYIRDYWAIPDWTKDVPNFNLNDLENRFNLWNDKNVEGFLVETSYSIGALGSVLYMSSQLGWEQNINVEATQANFLNDMFGDAAQIMKEVFDIWSDYTPFIDLPKSYNLLSQVDKLSLTELEKKRIGEFKKYIHYLHLLYEYDNIVKTKKKGKERQDKAEELIQYMWSIHTSKMVHTYRMHALFLNIYERQNSFFKEKYNLQNKLFKLNNWSFITPISSEQVQLNFENTLKKYAALNQSQKKYTHTVKDEFNHNLLQKYTTPSFNLTGSHTIKLSAVANVDYSIDVKFIKEKIKTSVKYLSITNSKGEAITELFVENAVNATQQLKFKVSKNELLTLTCKVKYSNIEVTIPNNIAWYFDEKVQLFQPFGTRHKFNIWIPSDVNTGLVKMIQSPDNLKLYSSDKKLIKLEKTIEPNLYSFKIPNNQSGNWWSFEAKTLLNLEWVNFSKFTFMNNN